MSIARQPASCGASASVVDDASPAAVAVHHAPDLSHASLAPLLALVEAHPLWQCRLFAACQAGELTLSDFRYLFGQYHEYSRNFTRYLAGVVASCDSDYLRARLTQNLWEEGGGMKPERRHSQLFRSFLVDTLGIAQPEQVAIADFTRRFVQRCLSASSSADLTYSAAFLSLGTEHLVRRIYTLFVQGLRTAGLADEQLDFFHLHIACDDAHAEVLSQVLLHTHAQPGWVERATAGLQEALSARLDFFESVYDQLQRRDLEALVERVTARKSLLPTGADLAAYRHAADTPGAALYQNHNQRLNIDFTVERVSCPGAQALDPRIVRIPAGRNNERHRHAHESLFHIISGSGEVHIGDRSVPVQAGDLAFVPRWEVHQTRNTGATELVILAITDFGLTSAILGNYDRTTRLAHHGSNAPTD